MTNEENQIDYHKISLKLSEILEELADVKAQIDNPQEIDPEQLEATISNIAYDNAQILLGIFNECC